MAVNSLYPAFKHWGSTGTIWIISDTHFADPDVEFYRNGKITDDELVKLINSCVGKHDVLIHLGDCGDLEYIKKLKGYKILIAGNHDTGLDKYKEVFNEVYSGPVMIAEKLILSHEPVDVPWAFNIHGHNHQSFKNDNYHLNCCIDANNYQILNFNKFMKEGHLSKITSLHRQTINKASSNSKRNKINTLDKKD